MSRVVLSLRLSPSTYQRVKIEGIDLESSVEHLKQEASRVANLPKCLLELVFCGNILEDEATLRACGVKYDSTIHVLKKKEKEPPAPTRHMSEVEIQDLVMAFKTYLKHPSYRSALHRLNRAEVLENIIQATPGLSDDPVALSILKEPELLVHMENIDTVRRIAELHPALADAAGHIAAVVQEEAVGGHHSSDAAGPSSGYSYSLDGLSEDDDMDSSQVLGAYEYSYWLDELGLDDADEADASQAPRYFDSSGTWRYSYSDGDETDVTDETSETDETDSLQSSDSQPRGSDLSRQQSYSTITSAQLAAALASATGFMSNSPQPSASGSASGLITPEMFNQAMQQAIANAGAGEEQSSSEVEGQSTPSSRHLTRQLQQMQEMGLADDALNRQALTATGGDVQAAIDLVFSWGLSSSPP